MSDNEMLKNAVKALEKKYSGNGSTHGCAARE